MACNLYQKGARNITKRSAGAEVTGNKVALFIWGEFRIVTKETINMCKYKTASNLKRSNNPYRAGENPVDDAHFLFNIHVTIHNTPWLTNVWQKE